MADSEGRRAIPYVEYLKRKLGFSHEASLLEGL
jgi:hypothetical protein